MAEITQQNPLGMRSLSEHNALGLAEDLKNKIFQCDWVFASAFDKLFLVTMLCWSIYAIWRIFLA